MKIGIQINSFNWAGTPENTGEKLAEIVKTADAVGFYSIWTMDHFFQIAPLLGMVDDPMCEAYTTLGFIAANTKKAKIGTLVAGVFYREPALLLKAVTTLDVLSGGRAYFGVGAGWYEREAIGLGFPLPTVKERFERLEETLKIAKHVWSGNREPFEGKHYTLTEPIFSPQPISKPHPPIIVGGGGEKKTLRFVAQYADACNVFAMEGVKSVRHKFDVLRRHCEDVGRDYSEIEKTVMSVTRFGTGAQKAEDVLEHIAELRDVGVDHIIYHFQGFEDTEALKRFGNDVISQL